MRSDARSKTLKSSAIFLSVCLSCGLLSSIPHLLPRGPLRCAGPRAEPLLKNDPEYQGRLSAAEHRKTQYMADELEKTERAAKRARGEPDQAPQPGTLVQRMRHEQRRCRDRGDELQGVPPAGQRGLVVLLQVRCPAGQREKDSDRSLRVMQMR